MSSRAQAGVEPSPHLSNSAPNLTGLAKPVLKPLAAVLPQIKAKSLIPVLLPSELPAVIGRPTHGHLDGASANEYEISLYYELGVGDAGFAGYFGAKGHPGYEPQELPNVEKVQLLSGLVGYFHPVSCGGSCSPANIWWKKDAILYSIQLKLSSTLREYDQKKAMIAVANSAILAGPR